MTTSKKSVNQQSLRTSTFAARPKWLVAFMLTGITLSLAACGSSDKASEKPAQMQKAPEAKADAKGAVDHEAGLKLAPEELERAGVKTETLEQKSFADVVTVTATIHPNQDRIVRVAPRVEGRIVRVTANLGDSVRPGQVLAVLDSVTLGEAQSTLLQAQSAQRVAQADYKRAEALNADEIISQRDYLRAKAEFEKSSAELRSAEDRVRLLGGSTTAGRADSTFQLTSPLAGNVVEKKATVGELRSPSDSLFTVADLSTLWIEANLTEDMLAKVRSGAAATVTVAAYPGERFAGRVTYVASLLDKDSRTIAARIEVGNKDGRLKPEMFATATIETAGAKRVALSVPDAAILLLQGQSTVFVADKDGFEPRAIETGDKLSGRTIVKSGLVTGDQVVVAGAYALKARLLKSQIGGE
ncbi:MAG: efflux RND transporter periplasmic adaptor subunit [Pseudomonadota bacterium]